VIQDPKSVESLIKAMGDNERSVRTCAAKAMCKIGTPKAVVPLIKALADSDKEVRTYAGDALERIGKSAVGSLIKALDDKQRIVRESAVNILDRLGWKPAKDEKGVKYYIVKANLEEYVDISTPAVGHDTKAQGDDGKNLLKRVVDTLIIMLDHKLRSVRQKAAAVLDKLGWKPAKDETGLKYHIVKANLEKYIDIGTPPIGRDIKTQGNDGKDILQKTIESSIKILDEKQKSTRKKGAGILDKLGWQPTMDETGAKYYIAIGNIGKCTEIGTAAVDLLIKELEDKNEGVRREAVNALGKIGDAKAVEPLVRALGDKNYGVCVDSVAALVKIGAPAVEPLIKALAEDGKEIHKRAIEALGKIGDTRAVEPLIQALEDENIGVRKSAVETLKKLYRSGNLSQEKKKVILKLKGQKITEHNDYEISPPDDCYLPSRHTDSPELYFNL
jgi:HEAT repeat protein